MGGKGVVDGKDDKKRIVEISLEGSSSSFLATRTPPAPSCPTQAHSASARPPTAAAHTARRAPKRLAPIDAFNRTSFGAAGRSYVALLLQSFSAHHVQECPPPPTPSPSLIDLLLLLLFSYSLNTHAHLRLSNPNHNTQAPPVSRAHPPLRVDLLRSLGRLPLARRGCVLLPWFSAWVPFNGVQGCVLGDRWVGLLWISVCWCTSSPPPPFLFSIILEKRLTCAKCS